MGQGVSAPAVLAAASPERSGDRRENKFGRVNSRESLSSGPAPASASVPLAPSRSYARQPVKWGSDAASNSHYWDPYSDGTEPKNIPNPVLIVGFITALWLTGLLGVQLYFSFSTMAANTADALQSALAPQKDDAAHGYVTQQELRARARKYSKDGYIILLVCNYGFHDFFTNWVLHAREFGYDKHFLAVAEDEGSYRYVNEHWPGHAVRVHVENIEQGQSSESLETAGLKSTTEKSAKGGASAMDTPEFLLIMYRRLFYLRSLMNSGVDVLLCDVDIAWLRDPMPYLKGPHDLFGVMEIQDPYYHEILETVALSPNATFYLCGGFLYFRSNPKAFLVLDHLLNKVFRAKRGKQVDNDQTFLRFVLLNLQDLDFTPSVGVVPQQRFPPGWLFFGNQSWRRKNLGKVVMIHNNWIRSKQCKVLRWLQYGFWKVPDKNGNIPYIEWSRQNDAGTIMGVRDNDWRVVGFAPEDVPYNASECRVGGGIVHKNELKRRD